MQYSKRQGRSLGQEGADGWCASEIYKRAHGSSIWFGSSFRSVCLNHHELAFCMCPHCVCLECKTHWATEMIVILQVLIVGGIININEVHSVIEYSFPKIKYVYTPMPDNKRYHDTACMSCVSRRYRSMYEALDLHQAPKHFRTALKPVHLYQNSSKMFRNSPRRSSEASPWRDLIRLPTKFEYTRGDAGNSLLFYPRCFLLQWTHFNIKSWFECLMLHSNGVRSDSHDDDYIVSGAWLEGRLWTQPNDFLCRP